MSQENHGKCGVFPLIQVNQDKQALYSILYLQIKSYLSEF